MIDFRCSFLVVSSGKLSSSEKRIWRPNTERVPVPVRSVFCAPRSSTSARRSRYCCSLRFMSQSPGESISRTAKAKQFCAPRTRTPHLASVALPPPRSVFSFSLHPAQLAFQRRLLAQQRCSVRHALRTCHRRKLSLLAAVRVLAVVEETTARYRHQNSRTKAIL